MEIGCNLEPETAETYKSEWELYTSFCQRIGEHQVPGRDKPWRIDVVSRYLWWQQNCNSWRTLAGVKSKLKHCGLCHGYLLPTAERDGSTKMRLQLAMVTQVIKKKQIKKKKAAGKSTAVKRSLALGRVAVGLSFSAHGAASARGFKKQSDEIQAMLTRCVSMSTGGMRFRLLRELWKDSSLRWSSVDNTYRFGNDWRKMKRGGPYTISFPSKPKFSSMIYPRFSTDGRQIDTFTAADVLGWRAKQVGSMKARRLFSSKGAGEPVRSDFQKFIRQTFKSLLVGNRKEIAKLVQEMTPHSFRAGMASDMHRAGVPVKTIMKQGRWESERAMSQYIRDGLGQQIRSAEYRRIPTGWRPTLTSKAARSNTRRPHCTIRRR